MKLSPFLIRVLDVLQRRSANDEYMTPKFIALEVFTRDHPGWQRSCKCGAYGSTRGSGLIMFMGGYLGRLRRAKLIEENWMTKENRRRKFWLTVAGQKLLADNQELLKQSGAGDDDQPSKPKQRKRK